MSLQTPTPLHTDNRAVSPTIGVILMVAVTVILAAVIGVYVLGIGTPDTAPNAQATFDAPASGESTVTLERTDSNKELAVRANGYNYGTVTRSGDTVEVYGLSNGDDIQLIYTGDRQSHIVQKHTYAYTSSVVNFECDASSGKYKVSKSAGSDNCEHATIQNAVDNASAGDTIQIYDGTYNENGLNVDKPLTIIGESQSGVEIIATNPETCDSFGVPCNVEVTSSDTTIKNLALNNTGQQFGLISTGSNTYIEQTTFIGDPNLNPQTNAYVVGTSATVTQSTIDDAGLQVANGGIVTESTFTNSYAGLTGGSTARNNDATGTEFLAASSNAVVEDNTITNTPAGIIVGGDDSTIRNNEITNATDVGITIQGNNTLVEYNTIENSGNAVELISFEDSGNLQYVTSATIQHNELVNNNVNILFSAAETERFDAADTHTVTDNIMYGAANPDIDERDNPTQSNADTAILQQNYWGHNDGANTNSDCTPDSNRLIGDTDATNPLCTAPTAGAGAAP